MGRWESAVSVHYQGTPGCSGVLVAERLVLTAGHCVSDTLDQVAIGGVDLDDPSGFEWIDVERATLYEDHWNTNDIGVLELAEAAVTAPAPLALGCAEAFVVDGAEASVVGFGNTELDGGGPTTRLHEADLAVVAADCQDASAGCNPGWNDLVAGGDGVDSCVGDSGGPLFVWGEGRPYLAATVSRAALPHDTTCGDGGVYVRVDGVADWITEVTGVDLVEAECDFVNTPPAPQDFSIDARVGETVSAPLHATDPDEGQSLEWTVSDSTLGAVTLGEELVFEARQVGEEVLTLRVTDGFDEASIEVPVFVTAAPDPPVVDAEPRNACSHAPGAGLLAVLYSLIASLRRRSPSSSSMSSM